MWLKKVKDTEFFYFFTEGHQLTFSKLSRRRRG